MRLVSTWYPKLSAITCILKNDFHLISSDPKLSNIFKQKPIITYRKNKSLLDHLLQNDIANQQLYFNVAPCGKCKLCPQINTFKLITNDVKHSGKNKRYRKLQGKGNNLRCTMFQAQGLKYWTYRRATFKALLQTSLRHQKEVRKQ